MVLKHYLPFAIIVVGIIASKNVKAMNRCVDAYMEELQKNFTLIPRDAYEYWCHANGYFGDYAYR